jgi:hypothetical protein
MKTFPTAGMDRATLLYTLLFALICSATIILPLIFLEEEETGFLWIPAVVLVAAPTLSYLLIPKLAVGDGKVIIKNTFANISVPVVSITDVERYDKVGFNIRSFGVGGLFGYFGYFNGNDVWYVTNIKRKVKITVKTGKVYMVSPENPDAFVAEILKMKASFP